MKSARIETDLKRRIEQSKDWVEHPTPVKGLHVRGQAAEAMPMSLLDSPKRADSHGVEFELDLEGESHQSVIVHVRIKPEWTAGREGTDSPPFVMVYVVHSGTGSEDLLHHDVIQNEELYPKLEALPIDQWYGVWLNRALAAKSNYKLFLKETQV